MNSGSPTHAHFHETQHSMLRRMSNWDYSSRCIYMLTLTTEGRNPLLGKLVINPDVPTTSSDYAHIQLTALGIEIEKAFWGISSHYPQISVLAVQVMPDHIHGLLFVREQMSCHLGQVVNGFKIGCNKAYRRLVLGADDLAGNAGDDSAAMPPNTGRLTDTGQLTGTGQLTDTEQLTGTGRLTGKEANPSIGLPEPATHAASVACDVALPHQQQVSPSHPKHGLLWTPGFHDRILSHQGQLEALKAYIKDNPRRLAIRRTHPEYFCRIDHLTFGETVFASLGNQHLLEIPTKARVQCSRSITPETLAAQQRLLLEAARHGTILVSPCISPGEKAIMKAALEEHLPIILLQENGFPPFFKPSGRYFDACSEGRLLVLAPWPYHTENRPITRQQCLQLNAMATYICEHTSPYNTK